MYSQNLRGKTAALKLNSTDTVRLWWMPVLVRGKLHVQLLPEDFPGECVEGAEVAVGHLPAILNARFPGASKPRTVMTDRGQGFYTTTGGNITAEYARALRQAKLRPLMGDNARIQPGLLQEAMLHETAVSWIRNLLKKTLPKNPWEETREQYGVRLKEVVRKINAEYDVHGLTHQFPKCIDDIIARDGDRIPN